MLSASYILSGYAQTNTKSIPADLGKLGNDFLNFFKDAKPYFTNDTIRIGVNGAYVDHKWGGFVDVVVPVNDQIGIGFAAAYINHSFYDASLNVNAGTTWNVPVLGSIYTAAETGPGYNLKLHEAVVQSSMYGIKKWNLGKWELAVNAGVLNISDLPGVGYFGGISGSYKW